MKNKVVLILILVGCATFLIVYPMLGLNFTHSENFVIAKIEYDAQEEVLVLVNRTSKDLNLSGYTLVDEANHVFDFSEDPGEQGKRPIIPAFDVVRIYSGRGAKYNYEDPRDFYWSRNYIWNNDGDEARLKDPSGETVVIYEYP